MSRSPCASHAGVHSDRHRPANAMSRLPSRPLRRHQHVVGRTKKVESRCTKTMTGADAFDASSSGRTESRRRPTRMGRAEGRGDQQADAWGPETHQAGYRRRPPARARGLERPCAQSRRRRDCFASILPGCVCDSGADRGNERQRARSTSANVTKTRHRKAGAGDTCSVAAVMTLSVPSGPPMNRSIEVHAGGKHPADTLGNVRHPVARNRYSRDPPEA